MCDCIKKERLALKPYDSVPECYNDLNGPVASYRWFSQPPFYIYLRRDSGRYLLTSPCLLFLNLSHKFSYLLTSGNTSDDRGSLNILANE